MGKSKWAELALEPYCWPFCCACLPPFGLLIGLICVVPCTVAIAVACFVIALILLPHDIFYTFYTLGRTPRLGPTIKVFAGLLLPAALLMWPFLILVTAAVCGFFYALFYPVGRVFMKNDIFFVGTIAKTFEKSFIYWPSKFWYFNKHSYFSYLEEYRRPLAQGERPFDVPIYWIPFGFVLAVLGVMVSFPAALVIGIIKVIPGFVRAEYELCKAYFKAECGYLVVCFIFFVLAFVLMPVAILGALIAFLLTSIFLGITPPGAAYRRGPIHGFYRIVHNIYEMDKFTNEVIFGWRHSVVPCCQLGEPFF